MDFFKIAFAPPLDVVHYLNFPVVLHITNRFVSVTRHFVVEFGDGGGDWVRVQVSRCGRMSQANDISILEEPQRGVGIVGRFVPTWEDDPIVVLILIMITSDLLLHRSNRERLHVGVK